MNQSAMLARFLRETAADVVMLAGRTHAPVILLFTRLRG